MFNRLIEEAMSISWTEVRSLNFFIRIFKKVHWKISATNLLYSFYFSLAKRRENEINPCLTQRKKKSKKLNPNEPP